MKSPTIKTNSYTLRAFKESDATLWQQWDTDPEVQAFMPEPKNVLQDIAKQHEYMSECASDESGLYWSIDTDDGATIGTVALTEINTHHKTADLGIVIGDKQYWRKGIATEVLQTLVEHAFSHLDIMRINAEVENGNDAMVRVLEKVGFVQDGFFVSARVKNTERIAVKHLGIFRP